MNKLQGSSFMLLLALLSLNSFGVVCPVFANWPEVQEIVHGKYPGTNNYYLNITISHDTENSTHYVDKIRVFLGGSNLTELNIGPQPLNPDNTFTFQYCVGPVEDSEATMSVTVHCSSDNAWSNLMYHLLPEFSLPMLVLALVLASTIAVAAFRKVKPESQK